MQASAPDGMTRGGRVTAAVRPERVALQAAGDGPALTGLVENVVYFGTDTTFHLTLDGGGPFVVRVQNREGARRSFDRGDRVVVRLPADALQVLRD